MENLKFRTTIKCSGCIAQATPLLNEAAGEGNWKVDITDPLKVLTVLPQANLSAAEVEAVVKEAGFAAESI